MLCDMEPVSGKLGRSLNPAGGAVAAPGDVVVSSVDDPTQPVRKEHCGKRASGHVLQGCGRLRTSSSGLGAAGSGAA